MQINGAILNSTFVYRSGQAMICNKFYCYMFINKVSIAHEEALLSYPSDVFKDVFNKILIGISISIKY